MITNTNYLSDLTIAPDASPAVRRRCIVNNRRLAPNLETIVAGTIIQVYSGSNGVPVIQSPTKTVRATYSALGRTARNKQHLTTFNLEHTIFRFHRALSLILQIRNILVHLTMEKWVSPGRTFHKYCHVEAIINRNRLKAAVRISDPFQEIERTKFGEVTSTA